MNPWRPSRPSGPKAKMFEVTWCYFKLKMSKMTHLKLTHQMRSSIWSMHLQRNEYGRFELVYMTYIQTHTVCINPLCQICLHLQSHNLVLGCVIYCFDIKDQGKFGAHTNCYAGHAMQSIPVQSNVNTKCIPVCSSLFFMDIQYFARHWTEQQKDSIKYWPIQIKWLGFSEEKPSQSFQQEFQKM